MANDTKYRQLRLDTAQKSLQIYLDQVDSLYIARPDMRKIVLEKEEEYQTNFERLQKAEQLKAEAKELERPVKRKKCYRIKHYLLQFRNKRTKPINICTFAFFNMA